MSSHAPFKFCSRRFMKDQNPSRPCFRLAFVLVVMATRHVSGEAGSRLVEPPARSSLWRYGYGTPVDFRDDQLNCGGFDRQYRQNGGLCGVCGDPWDEPSPRKYEAGNVTTLNPRPVRVYHMGGDIPVVIDSSANLYGQYEFRLCQLNSSDETPLQDCFKDNPLPIRESELGLTYRIGQTGGPVTLHLVLPKNFTCVHCLLQWRHVTGNRINKHSCVQCAAGQEKCNYCQGCGQQEWFQSCSDIAIYDIAGSHPAVRGTLTSQEVRQQWEQTLSDLKNSCACSATTPGDNAINSSTASTVSSTSDLSESGTTAVPSVTTPLLASFSTSSTYINTASLSTAPATSTQPPIFFTSRSPDPDVGPTPPPGGGGDRPVLNPDWWKWFHATTTTTTTTPPSPVRTCYIPHRPPWYLFNARGWCIRNCPRSGSACNVQICRPVRCAPPSSGNGRRNRMSWILPVLFPELFEL